MTTTLKASDFGQPTLPNVPALHNGDRLSQTEFHRRYEMYPKDVKFELIEGIVYMASPLRLDHGTCHPELSTIFTLYKASTPGTQVGDNATVMLDDENEVQPDFFLRLLPKYGGQSQTTEQNYVIGAPELVAEIAHSSVAIDLHAKLDSYRKAGVLEYIVVCIREEEVRWFALQSEDTPLLEDTNEILRSSVFPGLWLDPAALLTKNTNRLVAVLQEGLASDGYLQFVSRLQNQA